MALWLLCVIWALCLAVILFFIAIWIEWLRCLMLDSKVIYKRIMICPACQQTFLSAMYEPIMYCPDCGSLCFVKK